MHHTPTRVNQETKRDTQQLTTHEARHGGARARTLRIQQIRERRGGIEGFATATFRITRLRIARLQGKVGKPRIDRAIVAAILRRFARHGVDTRKGRAQVAVRSVLHASEIQGPVATQRQRAGRGDAARQTKEAGSTWQRRGRIRWTVITSRTRLGTRGRRIGGAKEPGNARRRPAANSIHRVGPKAAEPIDAAARRGRQLDIRAQGAVGGTAKTLTVGL
jgi:hypothetical protein